MTLTYSARYKPPTFDIYLLNLKRVILELQEVMLAEVEAEQGIKLIPFDEDRIYIGAITAPGTNNFVLLESSTNNINSNSGQGITPTNQVNIKITFLSGTYGDPHDQYRLCCGYLEAGKRLIEWLQDRLTNKLELIKGWPANIDPENLVAIDNRNRSFSFDLTTLSLAGPSIKKDYGFIASVNFTLNIKY